MASVEIREATIEDAEFVARTARAADIDELWASNLSTPHDAIMIGMRLSDSPMAAVAADGTVLAVFGVACESLIGRVGVPWLIASRHVHSHVRGFAEASKPGVADMLKKYDRLENFVDCRNRLAINWLKWIGFKFKDAAPHGPFKLPFCEFYIEREA